MVGYRPYTPKDSPEPLELTLPYVQAEVARFWSMKPWEFRVLDIDQKAELHATYKIKQEIDLYYSSERARKMDSKK